MHCLEDRDAPVGVGAGHLACTSQLSVIKTRRSLTLENPQGCADPDINGSPPSCSGISSLTLSHYLHTTRGYIKHSRGYYCHDVIVNRQQLMLKS